MSTQADVDIFASRLPGRIRIRHASLRDERLASVATERLRRLPETLSVVAHPRAASLLFLYAPDMAAQKDIEDRVFHSMIDVLPISPDASKPDTIIPGNSGKATNDRPVTRHNINRSVKIGMLTSLAASLGALTASRRMHAAAGTLYLAFLLAHLVTYRRSLVR